MTEEDMASFDTFFPTLLKHERGFVNHPVDPGARSTRA